VLRTLRPPYYVLENNFINLGEFIGHSSNGGFVRWVSLSALSMIGFIAICSFLLLSKGQTDSRPLVIFLARCMRSSCVPDVEHKPAGLELKATTLQGCAISMAFQHSLVCGGALYRRIVFVGSIPSFPVAQDGSPGFGVSGRTNLGSLLWADLGALQNRCLRTQPTTVGQ